MDNMFLWIAIAYAAGSAAVWYLRPNNTVSTIEDTVDKLIKDGYLKTQGTGDSQKILKHTEWCNEND